MFSEGFEMLDRCPKCLEGELKFIHINLEEDVKMCTNEQCVYPFVEGVVDEFVPSKIKVEEGSYNYESVAALLVKIDKEYEADCLEWDKYAESNEFLVNIDRKAACEFVDKLDEFVGDSDEDCFKMQKFLDSLGDAARTSASSTACEDSVNAKLIQSHIDTGKTEVNTSASDEYMKSIISELEEMQSENNQADMQWDAEDFNAETFEMNNSVEKNVVISHSEDLDPNVNEITEHHVGVFAGACEGGPPAVPDHTYHSVHGTSVIAKESEVQSMDNSTSKEGTDDIISKSSSPSSDHTYCRPSVTASESLKAHNDFNINMTTALEQGNSDAIIGKFEARLSLSDHNHDYMLCTSTSMSTNTAAVDSEMPENLNVNVNSGQGVGDIVTGTHKDIPFTSDHTNNFVHSVSQSMNTNTAVVEIQKDISNFCNMDPYGKTIIVRSTENIPLHHHFGSKYLKSVCVIRPPKTKGNHDLKSSQIIYTLPNVNATTASREGQSGLETLAAAEQVSPQLRHISKKLRGSTITPCINAFSSTSTSIYTGSLTDGKGGSSGLETTAAPVVQPSAQLNYDSKKPNITTFSHDASISRSSITPNKGGPSGGLETFATVVQASEQLNYDPKKPNITTFSHDASISRSSLTPNKGGPSGGLETVATVVQASEQLNYDPKKPNITTFSHDASISRSSLISNKGGPSGGLETVATVVQASAQLNYDPKKPNITTFSHDASISRSSLTPNKGGPSGGLETVATVVQASEQLNYDSKKPNIATFSHDASISRSSLTPNKGGPSGGLETVATVVQASAQLNYDPKKPNITTFSHDASISRSSLTPNKGGPSGGLETVATVVQASAQLNYDPKKPNITTFSHDASISRSSLTPNKGGPSGGLETVATVVQASEQLNYDPKKPNITTFSHDASISRSSLTPNKGGPSGGLETVATVVQASAQLNYDPKKPNITTFSHALTSSSTASGEAPSGLGTAAAVETCAQISCTSQKPNVDTELYMHEFNRLFAKNNTSSLAKFDFPKFDTNM